MPEDNAVFSQATEAPIERRTAMVVRHRTRKLKELVMGDEARSCDLGAITGTHKLDSDRETPSDSARSTCSGSSYLEPESRRSASRVDATAQREVALSFLNILQK